METFADKLITKHKKMLISAVSDSSVYMFRKTPNSMFSAGCMLWMDGVEKTNEYLKSRKLEAITEK